MLSCFSEEESARSSNRTIKWQFTINLSLRELQVGLYAHPDTAPRIRKLRSSLRGCIIWSVGSKAQYQVTTLLGYCLPKAAVFPRGKRVPRSGPKWYLIVAGLLAKPKSKQFLGHLFFTRLREYPSPVGLG